MNFDIGEMREGNNVKEEILVSISDTGKGISPQIMPKLFEKFNTGSNTGTGLGLYITRNLVKAHGGKIWAFNNKDGIGATFVFSLPKANLNILQITNKGLGIDLFVDNTRLYPSMSILPALNVFTYYLMMVKYFPYSKRIV